MNSRRISRAVLLGVAVALAAVLTGCSGSLSEDYAQICRDNTTQNRLPDGDCGDTGRNASWYFLPLLLDGSTTVPAVGAHATGGTRSLPTGKSAARGMSAKGSSVYKASSSSHYVVHPRVGVK